MGLTGTSSADDAERQLQQAIELGELTAQHAPAGHPIFGALERAGLALEYLQDEDNAHGPTLAAGSEPYNIVDGAIDGIYAAAAEVRNAPDLPLPRTLFALPATSIPWAAIGAGAAALGVGWYLFRRQSRRRRRYA